MGQNGVVDVRIIHSASIGRLTRVQFNRHNRGIKRYFPTKASFRRLYKWYLCGHGETDIEFGTHFIVLSIDMEG